MFSTAGTVASGIDVAVAGARELMSPESDASPGGAGDEEETLATIDERDVSARGSDFGENESVICIEGSPVSVFTSLALRPALPPGSRDGVAPVPLAPTASRDTAASTTSTPTAPLQRED
ncbi:unnamed protein product, partial [Sphacelaria rigidula]